MSDIQFKQYRDPFSKEVDASRVWYFDADGHTWNLVEGSWQWRNIFQPWTSAGNVPDPADPIEADQ
jgi:hypothetical protein